MVQAAVYIRDKLKEDRLLSKAFEKVWTKFLKILNNWHKITTMSTDIYKRVLGKTCMDIYYFA